MASIRMTLADIVDLECALRSAYPRIEPLKLTRALVKGLAIATEPALWKEVVRVADKQLSPEHTPYRLLDSGAFCRSLPQQDERQVHADDVFERLVAQVPGMLSTVPSRGPRVSYRCKRERAWRALMVSAINAGLKQKLFPLAMQGEPRPTNEHQFFDFNLPGGILARGSFRELAYGELSLFAAMRPTGGHLWGANAGFLAARDAYGGVWLDRVNGAWVEPFLDTFACNDVALDKLCAMEVTPLGFGDRADCTR